MTPTVPVTPEPAVAGPFTGGQKVAQDPLQLDVVEVSGPNQYKVRPAELVSTWAPPIVLIINVLADEPPAACAVLCALEDVELDELAHAATASAAAARPAAVSSFCIGRSLLTPCMSPVSDHVVLG